MRLQVRFESRESWRRTKDKWKCIPAVRGYEWERRAGGGKSQERRWEQESGWRAERAGRNMKGNEIVEILWGYAGKEFIDKEADLKINAISDR
jgi:hypothetical protein